MPGTKRKASFATPGARPSKLAKRSTRDKVARSVSGGDAPAPPALRKAATLTMEDKEAASLSKKTSSKRVSSAKPSLTKKVSSVVVEGGTVTTVVPLKSGASVGETSLVSKESLKKAASITKSLSKTPSVTAGSSAVVAPPLPPGGLLEVAISFDTTGSMYGVLEEVRAKVKDLAQRLQADIPGIRIAVIAHGDYCDADKYIVKWIDFGASLPELCDFVEKVDRTYGGDGPECYELVLKRAREELSWTPGSQRVLVMIGDDEPHPVGYTYNKKKYYIDWKEECELLKQMGAKVYGVQSGSDSGATKFFSKMAELTLGRHVNLTNFSSIFDFLMMICYREGNPDMLPVYASEVRARHVGGMAKDMEALVKKFGGSSASKTSFKAVAASKLKASKAKPKGKVAVKKPAAKAKKTEKKAKKEKKVKGAAAKGKAKKALPKTSVKKIKGKTMKRKPKKKKVRGKKKLLREKLNDAKFLTGPLLKLTWSKWILAITDSRPRGYSSTQFRRSKRAGWGSTFHKQNIFDQTTPAVFEVGVRFPEIKRRKIYVMYFKRCDSMSYRVKTVEALTLIKDGHVRNELAPLVWPNKLKVYIRRGTGSKDEVRAASKYMYSFDYALGWKRKGQRKVEKNGIILSH